MNEDKDPIVGHKSFRSPDGSTRHEPLRQNEADLLMKSLDEEKAKRAALMPTEEDAVRMMCSAHHRLKELGWRETMYGPTNVVVKLIEPGSSGIHEGVRDKPWPEKTWWSTCPEMWPMHPCLFKSKG